MFIVILETVFHAVKECLTPPPHVSAFERNNKQRTKKKHWHPLVR